MLVPILTGPLAPPVLGWEPRVLYEEIPVDGSTLDQHSHPAALMNHERLPLRITHLVASVAYAAPESIVNRIGLALLSRGDYYMHRTTLPLPAWQNVSTTAGRSVTSGLSAWRFAAPCALHAGEHLQVQVQLALDDPAPIPVQVGLSAVARRTRQLHFLSDELRLTHARLQAFDPLVFHNAREETLDLQGLTVNVHAPLSASDPLGDVRRVRLSIEPYASRGRGAWFRAAPERSPLLPAGLLGVTTGRSVVHRFPDAGPVLAPGQGFVALARSLVSGLSCTLQLGLVGHLCVLG